MVMFGAVRDVLAKTGLRGQADRHFGRQLLAIQPHAVSGCVRSCLTIWTRTRACVRLSMQIQHSMCSYASQLGPHCMGCEVCLKHLHRRTELHVRSSLYQHRL